MVLRLKGFMRVSHFTLEVDHDFKDILDVERFINWAENLRRFHEPVREGS